MTTIALIGPHGAGKTTLGRLLARALRVPFHPEIGRALRERALRRDPAAHAAAHQPTFDDEVIGTELSRDIGRTWGRGRVVESWHPGNFAYAALRNPEVVARWWRTCATRVEAERRLGEGILVLPLRFRRDTARNRLSEPGPDPETTLDFFAAVADQAAAFAHRLPVLVLPDLWTDDVPPQQLLAQAMQLLAPHAPLRAPSSSIRQGSWTLPGRAIA